jgi:hypothetical protein
MAETDGSRLYLVTCVMTRTATLYCVAPNCDGLYYWYPRRR